MPGRFDTWQWVRAGVEWKAYDKLLVPPVEVWINPQAAYPGIVPDVSTSASPTTSAACSLVVSGEVEALDGVSGERLIAQVTTRKDAHLFVGQNLSWDDVRDAATEWANQARARLDAARAGQR